MSTSIENPFYENVDVNTNIYIYIYIYIYIIDDSVFAADFYIDSDAVVVLKKKLT